MTDENKSKPDAVDENRLENLKELWATLSIDKRIAEFQGLTREDAEELFLSLTSSDHFDLMRDMNSLQRRSWLRLLPPDDAADLIQEFPHEERAQMLALLDIATMREVVALLAYAEDDAGGLMNPRFLRLRPDVSVEVAIRYIRAQAKAKIETIHYVYVLDHEQFLLGALSFRDLLLAPPDRLVSEIMRTELITLPEDMDQEEVGRQFSQSSLSALPVVDAENRMKGIITIDDVVEVVQQEATEDIHKLGGSEALDEPYLQVGLVSMIRKRAGWLVFLFLGEMLTATAMQYFQVELEKAVVLALFLPLIISSGGNSGSQATSLMIRAFALKDVRQKDWWRVFFREMIVGLSLGAILGAIGLIRIFAWPHHAEIYGEHYRLVGLTVATSLVGIVLWGSLMGSMLPFVLRKLRFDPATSSAPFVATLVDVTGLVIYFTVASLILKGTLL